MAKFCWPIISAEKSQDRMPMWAILQRRLIDTINEAVDLVVEKYIYPDGTIMWPPNDDYSDIDALDDAYESFHNWPLFYLIGGDEKFLKLSHKEYNAITEQFTRYDCGHGHPMVVKEYEQGYDWMHQGEGYLFFYLLNLADPNDERNKERSIRYAGFYLNEDPEVQNYDPRYKILKCCYVGSMGPAHRNFRDVPWSHAPWKEYYGLPFHDVEGITTIEDIKDEQKALAMARVLKKRWAYSDTIINLSSTTMVMNAYLHTGDDKYRQWIEEYAGAWQERTLQNGGLVPDNVGPHGIIGECMEGKWYGGYYGWTWPHGFYCIADSLTIASENLCLLRNDRSTVSWIRDQVKHLIELGIEKDGTLFVPHKHADPGAIQEYCGSSERCLTMEGKVTDREDFVRFYEKDGWFEYQPLLPVQMAHVWMVSQSQEDMDIIRSIRDHRKRSWERILHFYAKDQGGHEAAWLNFLEGGFPDYPEKIMEHNLFQVYNRLKYMREDTQDPKTYTDAYLQMRNPVNVEGLVQLTMGGPLPVYNGGLLMVSVRYFDVDRQRSGLPPDVSALIDEICPDGIRLTLVNIHPMASRRVLIQAGAFGEHRFTTVSYRQAGEVSSAVVDVNGDYLQVELNPGTILEMNIGMKRFCNRPSYRQPWQ